MTALRVGIVADTHMPRFGRSLPPALAEGLRQVDLILHAGDWSDESAVSQLSDIAPVEGVHGNADGPAIRARFGERKLLLLGGRRIGLVHGHGKGLTTERRALQAFDGEEVDAVVFGHSHVPLLAERNGVLLFNPGSPTDKRRQPMYSFGLMEIGDGAIQFRHVFYADKTR